MIQVDMTCSLGTLHQLVAVTTGYGPVPGSLTLLIDSSRLAIDDVNAA